MRIKPEVEADLRRTIRDARAKDPLITTGRVKELLEKKYERGFSYQCVARLVEKVAREALIEVDRAKIQQRMSFTRESYRMMRGDLLKVVYWKPDPDDPGNRPPRKADIVEAAKTVVMLDLALLRAEIETGMYKKPIQMLAQDIRYAPLPGELLAVVIAAWARGGLLPAAAIERMVPEGLPSQTPI